MAKILAREEKYEGAWKIMQEVLLIISVQLNQIFIFATEQERFQFLSTLDANLYLSLGLMLADQPKVRNTLYSEVLNFKGLILDSSIRQKEKSSTFIASTDQPTIDKIKAMKK